MRQIESHNERVAREKQVASVSDLHAKLDAIMAHLKLEAPKATEVEPAPEVDESHLHDKDGEVGGVPEVRAEQRKVPAKVSDIPDIRQETGPADGGRADGTKPKAIDAKSPKFPPGVTDETKTRVIGELQEEASNKAEKK